MQNDVETPPEVSLAPDGVDVAREAGVSPATVDRVLNNRSGVRSRTRDVVLATARRLGYIAAPTGGGRRSRRRSRPLRLDFVLPRGTNAFMRMLHEQIEAQGAARPDLEVRVATIEGFNPDSLAADAARAGRPDRGIGVVALDHPTVREAIRGSPRRHPVVTLASDILHVPRTAYVGIDNRQAGRLAGYVLGPLLGPGGPRKVALFAGSLSYRGHEEREMGFRDVLAEDFPDLQSSSCARCSTTASAPIPRPRRSSTARRSRRHLQHRRGQPGHRPGARRARAGAAGGLHRPRRHAGDPGAAARRDDGRGHRPEPARRGARGAEHPQQQPARRRQRAAPASAADRVPREHSRGVIAASPPRRKV